jgi:tetratricopeptide (TPR) repeat protein
MRLALLSNRCFHCVDVDEFLGDEPVARRASNLVGTPCPLCELTIQHDDLTIVMDSADMDRIQNGTATWDTTGRQPTGFEGFFPERVPESSSTDIGRMLRRQVGAVPSARRKQMCEISTSILLSFAAKGAHDAEQQGDTERARRAYQAIADYGEDRPAAAAAIQLAQIEQADGDDKAVIRAYRKAALTSDRTLRSIACLYLGMTLEEAGDRTGARHAYQECVADGDGETRAHAAYVLGNLLRADDPQSARAAYEIVLAEGDGKYAAGAALNLGVIEDEQGHRAEAMLRWDYAFAIGDERERTVAAFNLGHVWEDRGNLWKAKTYYRVARESSQPDAAQRARARLRELG